MMTENDIALALLIDRYRQNTCMPRYTPDGWYEADVAEVTKAGFFCEYEIKLSKADFRKDAIKQDDPPRRRYWKDGEQWGPHLSKHVRLSMGDPKGPASFYFVTPIDLLTKHDIPNWAGWIEAAPKIPKRAAPYHLQLLNRKTAPRLHHEKLDTKIVQHMKGVAYYRLHTAYFDLARALNNCPEPHPEPISNADMPLAENQNT